MIVKHSYTRSRRAARAAVRYYELRPRGRDEEPRNIFDAGGTLTRTEACDKLNTHQNGNYLVHRVTLSPSDPERPENLRDMARYILHELEKEKGQQLHWIAVEHRNTAHHHVHVVIAGTGEREDDGATRGVKLTKADYEAMRDAGREYCRMMNRVTDRWDEEMERESAPDREESADRWSAVRPAAAADPEDDRKRRRRRQLARSPRDDHER